MTDTYSSTLITGGNSKERFEEALKNSGDVQKEDLIILESETTIGIENVRELKPRLILRPYASQNKVVIIHEAEKLTMAAQNAFLKTLEEPPQDTILILTVSNKDLLLPTILSRCQIIELPAKMEVVLSEEEIEEQISFIRQQLRAKAGARLKLASEVAKEKELVINFLNNGLFAWREIMLRKNQNTLDDYFRQVANRQIIAILRQIQEVKRLIRSNINQRLAIENFLLNLPEFP
ncbi:hypothetical protein HY439_01250 [Candidatus Microgenomates bacterium]|nr:hypothetical protein [Candidatus Microgenomates bacterium]